MILHTPTEDENGEASRRTFSPGFVIPAQAEIQVSFPIPISLDTRWSLS